jgi:uncharacterized membrane-anchored protein
MKMDQALKIAIYGAPLLVLLLWTGKLESQRRQGRRIEVPIVGVDPRDLISGHFVQFHLDLGADDPCKNPKSQAISDEKPVCVCWRSGDSVANIESVKFCQGEAPSCELLMRGQCEGLRFSAGIERFYIPEEDAKYLHTLPRGSHLVVRLTEDGRSFAEELRPEGLDYDGWIKKMKNQP